MTKTFTIANQTFASKTAAKDRCSEILAATPIATRLTGLDGALLRAALDLHCHADKLKEKGCVDIVVMPHRDYKQFRVLHDDDTTTAFSFKECFFPDERTHQGYKKHAVTVAFRAAIDDQRTAVRDAALGTLVASTGVLVTASDVINVDHAGTKPFAKLLEGFLKSEGIEWEDVELTEVDGSAGDYRLFDEGVSSRWETYHEVHAILVAMHVDDHRRKDGAKAKSLDETLLCGSQRRKESVGDVKIQKEMGF